MSDYLFAPQPPASLPIAGLEQRFPVHRVFCVGRNYEAHAKEMGNEVDRAAPFYFMKSAHHIALAAGAQPMASRTQDYHYETELVMAIGTGGRQISKEQALSHVYGYAVGLDMTRRDLQAAAKAKGRPWDTAKNVESSGLVSVLQPATANFDPGKGEIGLKQNGTVVQRADLSEQVWHPAEIIADLSSYYCLQPGDLIFTGTPAGVGSVAAGDHLEGWIEGLASFELRMTDSL